MSAVQGPYIKYEGGWWIAVSISNSYVMLFRNNDVILWLEGGWGQKRPNCSHTWCMALTVLTGQLVLNWIVEKHILKWVQEPGSNISFYTLQTRHLWYFTCPDTSQGSATSICNKLSFNQASISTLSRSCKTSPEASKFECPASGESTNWLY